MTESENLAARVFWLMGLIPNMTSDAAADACRASAYRGGRDLPSLDPLTQNPTAVAARGLEHESSVAPR